MSNNNIQLYTEGKLHYLDPIILKEQYKRRPKIAIQCIDSFAKNCPYSYHKCVSINEVEEKIYKMFLLGTEIVRDVIEPEIVYFHYGNRVVVYDSVTDEIINIIKASSSTTQDVPEEMKAEYDYIIQKIMV